MVQAAHQHRFIELYERGRVRIAERRASGRDEGDLLSMLLAAQDEDGSSMTNQQLRDEIITLFLAGQETTALTLSWTWYLLARHPDVEKKFHEEIDLVLESRSGLRSTAMRAAVCSCGAVRSADEQAETEHHDVAGRLRQRP